MNGGEQTSGSITLNTDGLANAVVNALRPLVSQLDANMVRVAALLSSAALSEEATAAVLAHYLPFSQQRAEETSERQAQGLAEAGYALVAVAHPALEVEAQRLGFAPVVEPLAPIVEPKVDQLAREDEWFAPGRDD